MGTAKKKKAKNKTNLKRIRSSMPRFDHRALGFAEDNSRSGESAKSNLEKGTCAAIKKSISDLGRGFSKGADKVADILLDKSQERASNKAKRVKDESVSVIKEVSSNIKENLKDVKPKKVLCGASYGMGRFSRMAKDTCVDIFNDLVE